jgi:hypothetical protein
MRTFCLSMKLPLQTSIFFIIWSVPKEPIVHLEIAFFNTVKNFQPVLNFILLVYLQNRKTNKTRYLAWVQNNIILPSESTTSIISYSSASEGFMPSCRSTVPSSLVVIIPSPSWSKLLKTSLNSEIIQIN